MKIAMFGGSFDPIHNDHVKLCETMLHTFNLDKVIVFPAACSPFKSGTQTDDTHRLKMCRLAFENYLQVQVSDYEILKGGKSYTVDTLDFIKDSYPDSELFLITGADAFLTLDKWFDAKRIFSLSHILTVVRDSDDIDVLKCKAEEYKSFGAKLTLVSTPIGTISSTKVRNAIRNKQDIKGYLPPEVSEYIRENRLYGYED